MVSEAGSALTDVSRIGFLHGTMAIYVALLRGCLLRDKRGGCF